LTDFLDNPKPAEGGLAPPRSIGEQGEVIQLDLTLHLHYKDVETNWRSLSQNSYSMFWTIVYGDTSKVSFI